MQYFDIYDIKLRNRQCGKHFFDADAMRFFASRVGREAFAGDEFQHVNRARNGSVWFVTSEQFRGSGGYVAKRKYTVRMMDWATGDVSDCGGFQRYASSGAATREAKRLASLPTVAEVQS